MKRNKWNMLFKLIIIFHVFLCFPQTANLSKNIYNINFNHCLRPQALQQQSPAALALQGNIENITDRTQEWLRENAPMLIGKTIVTMSMEGHIPELPIGLREAVTKGGLGAYFGDKLEGLSDLGVNGIGMQLLYAKRVRQRIYGYQTQEPRQHIDEELCYTHEKIDELIKQGVLEKVLNHKGEEPDIKVALWDEKDPLNEYRNPHYKVRVVKINRGGTPDYLFFCPEVADILYTDRSKIHRFTQEVLLAKAGVQLCNWFLDNQYKADGRNVFKGIDIAHINEAHVYPFVAILRGYPHFMDTAAVYTNHTIVPAGLEKFPVQEHSPDSGILPVNLERAFYQLGIPGTNGEYLNNIRGILFHGNVIDNCRAAATDCEVCNAVSPEHGVATNRLFGIESVGILNGSGRHWVLKEILELENNGKVFDSDNTDDLFLAWNLHQKGKDEACEIVEKRIKDVMGVDVRLDRVKPTLWLVRRMVEYKLSFPMLKDIIHVLCAEKGKKVQTAFWGQREGLGMQVVVGGLAPVGSETEAWVSEYLRWMEREDLKGRFFYVPDSDTEILRAQAIGSDLCANVPEKEEEACGTSDQRNARNFGVNIATTSGGPREYLEEVDVKTGNGSAFFLNPIRSNRSQIQGWEKHDPHTYRDRLTCFESPREFLEALTKASTMYYDFIETALEMHGLDGADARWLRVMVNSHNAGKKVTAEAMERRYATEVYPLALQRRKAKMDEAIRSIDEVILLDVINSAA